MYGRLRVVPLAAAFVLAACGGGGSQIAPLKTSGEIYQGFRGEWLVVHPEDYTGRIADWTVGLCGEDCVTITQTRPSPWTARARLVEREWRFTVDETDSWICGEATGDLRPGAAEWKWNASNLMGTVSTDACEGGNATVGIGLRKRV